MRNGSGLDRRGAGDFLCEQARRVAAGGLSHFIGACVSTRRRGSDLRERIYAVVSRVPRGRVATYGQVARLAGIPGHARQVGYALHALPEGSRLPWHRVVNRAGTISARSTPGFDRVQRVLLEAEGVEPDGKGRISLDRFLWVPALRRTRPGGSRGS